MIALAGGAGGVGVAGPAHASSTACCREASCSRRIRDAGAGIRLDPWIARFTARVVALLTGVLFSLAPIAGAARGRT